MKNNDLKICLFVFLAGLPSIYAANLSLDEQVEIVAAHNNWRSQVYVSRLH